MRFMLFSMLFTWVLSLSAQVGVVVAHQWSKDGFRTSSLLKGGSLQEGQEIGIDYWFRLKEKRVEFLPTLSFGTFKGNLTDNMLVTQPSGSVDFRFQTIGFQFKTNIYPFDFGTDCDCPTWGKQGPALHKGFFIQIAPGIVQVSASTSPNYYELAAIKDQAWLPTMSLGAGMDFGVSKFLTVSPMLIYRRSLGDFYWTALEQIDDLPFEYGTSKAQLAALQFAIRLGFRLDHRRW